MWAAWEAELADVPKEEWFDYIMRKGAEHLSTTGEISQAGLQAVAETAGAVAESCAPYAEAAAEIASDTLASAASAAGNAASAAYGALGDAASAAGDLRREWLRFSEVDSEEAWE